VAAGRLRKSKLKSGFGHPDLQGLLRGLVDWSWELRRLLAAQNKKSRRGETPAANGTVLGEGQAFTE
jgi:hypothetical protein